MAGSICNGRPGRRAARANRVRRVFLRDMLIDGRIGVYAHEHGRSQRLRVNVDLLVDEEAGGPARDDLALVVDYARLAEIVRATVGAEHVKLVETLAERIAAASFFDSRVRQATIRVEKLDAFDDIGSVGVEIVREAGDLSTRAD